MFVLVVDDDPIARMTHLALLAKLPELKAAGAGCVAEARREVQKRQPDAVLLDMQLPDGNGLEVMSLLDEQCGYGTHGPVARVLIVSAQLEPEKPAGWQNPRLHKLAKPVQLRELLAYFRPAPAASEPLSPFVIGDYIQLACAGAYSVRLQCSGPGGSGEIRIVDGQLWSAHDAHGSGDPAFHRLTRSGSRVQVITEGDERPPRDLLTDWESLLLQSVRPALTGSL